MKTPEDIKKGLECCAADEPCGECPYRLEVEMCIGMIARDALSYIRKLENQVADLGKKVPKWIDVKEQLPEKGAPVVALCRYDFTPDKYYLQFERYDPRSNMWQDGSVRNWLTLPKPPKEEQHD